jgi:hypothetical protein
MISKTKFKCIISSILAFILCFIAGLYLLIAGKDPLSRAIGLYFIGKAFFVGPMLYLESIKL